jgi:hypothetical protein
MQIKSCRQPISVLKMDISKQSRYGKKFTINAKQDRQRRRGMKLHGPELPALQNTVLKKLPISQAKN